MRSACCVNNHLIDIIVTGMRIKRCNEYCRAPAAAENTLRDVISSAWFLAVRLTRRTAHRRTTTNTLGVIA